MTLKDVKLINRTNKKSVFIGVVLVFVGSALSVYSTSYGWLLGAVSGVIAVFVSLRFQQSQLLKAFEVKANAKVVVNAEVKTKVIRKSEASG